MTSILHRTSHYTQFCGHKTGATCHSTLIWLDPQSGQSQLWYPRTGRALGSSDKVRGHSVKLACRALKYSIIHKKLKSKPYHRVSASMVECQDLICSLMIPGCFAFHKLLMSPTAGELPCSRTVPACDRSVPRHCLQGLWQRFQSVLLLQWGRGKRLAWAARGLLSLPVGLLFCHTSEPWNMTEWLHTLAVCLFVV